jgi:hypothetical protein
MQLVTLASQYLKYPIPNFDYDNCVLAGGAIRDSIQDIKFKDLDVFGPSKEELEYFAEKNLIHNGYKKVFTSQWAWTYVKSGTGSVQLVYGRPLVSYEQLFGEFPFTLNQFAYNGQDIIATPEAIIDTLTKVLRLNTLAAPDIFDTLNRIKRYTDKGYQEIEGTTDKVLEFIQNMPAAEVEKYSVRPKGFSHGGY